MNHPYSSLPLALASFFIWAISTEFATAAITAVGPFTGTHSESWESFPFGDLGDDPVSFLGGNATIWEGGAITHMSIYRTQNTFCSGCFSFGLGPFPAKTADGIKGFGNSISSLEGEINLSTAATAFGGYWGTTTTTQPIIFEFFNSSGDSIGMDQFFYTRPNNNGTLEWTGWEFSEPVTRIEYTGRFTVNDALQFNLVPEPVRTVYLILAAVIGALRYRSRRTFPA